MRLHRLTLGAFGPFAAPVDVDFDALGAGGIFLIHGATGSGKTSLLDAICFALFARLPGDRPAGAALSSQHAEAEAIPTVTLEATLGGRRLRITRSPDHPRAKRRGSGTTMAKASVLVQQWEGSRWVTRTTRADEAGLVIGDALGMHLDQFVKVVLLPQGDFAAFLQASADQRAELLERLFDISRYVDVERWLAQQRRSHQLTLEVAEAAEAGERARIHDLVATLPEHVITGVAMVGVTKEGAKDESTTRGAAAGERATADPAADSHAITGPDPIPALRRLLERLRGHAVATLAEGDRADSASEAAELAVVRATTQTRDRARGERAQTELAELTRRADDLELARRRAAAAERAEQVAGDLRTQAALDADSTRAEVALAQSVARLGELGVEASDLTTSADGVARHDEAVAQLLLLDARARAASEQQTARRRALEEVTATLTELRTQQAQLQARQQRCAARTEQLAAVAGQLPELTRQADELDRLAALRAHLDVAQAELGSTTTRAQSARQSAQDARQAWLDLRQRRLDGMAAELASALSPGEPCPVCGAAEHPTLARTSDPVSEAHLATAQERWERLDAASAAASARVAAATERVQAHRRDLASEPRDHASLVAAATAVRGLVPAARAAADELEQLRGEHAQLADQSRAVAERIEQSGAAVAQAEGRLAALDADLQRDRTAVEQLTERHTRECPCAAPSTEAAQLAAEHRAVGDAIAAAVRAQDASAAAIAAVDAQRERVQLACAAAGFADSEAAAAARLEPGIRQQLSATLAAAERTSTNAEAVLDDPAVRLALEAEPVDLEAVTEAARAARAVRVGLERDRTLAELAVRELSAGIERLEVAVATTASAAERADRSRRLADTVAGLGSDNVMRMRLSAFVLAGRLERVVELANERLALMGSGRYRLLHSDAREGAKRSGLGLRVEDQWTGRSRETTTLSGGESFMASLALALGLADAVREESGGADMQTLFIDEGFGTLDEESLEQVMAVLDQLRDGGRSVGVVSHVADLRARIPTQLRVLKAADGSTVELVDGVA